MTAGVSPVAPQVVGTPAGRTAYAATPISPSVQKATTTPEAQLPSRYDPSMTEPRPATDGVSGISIYA
jgi:hypothetical protein